MIISDSPHDIAQNMVKIHLDVMDFQLKNLILSRYNKY